MAGPPDSAPIAEQRAWAARAVLGAVPTGSEAERDVRYLLGLVDRLETMLEHTSDMITVVRADGSIRFSNAAAGVLTGHDETVNDTSALELVHPDDVAAARDVLVRCLEALGSEVSTELRIRHADGSWHYVDVYAKNCLDGPVEGVVVSMRDVCRRREAEQTLSRANEAMRDFVAVASHDLRSPVTVITGLASTLVNGWELLEDGARLEMARLIATSGERLGRLVENLLTISRLSAGVSAPQGGRVRLRQAVRGVMDEALAAVPGAGEVDVRVAPELVVHADPEAVQRIVANYVHNALIHGRLPVVVDAAEHAGRVVVRVSDGGPGVPEELRRRLFERFARGPTGGGSGLGLSIVRELARASGGDAWLEGTGTAGPGSPPGAGRGRTCFCVSFPSAGQADRAAS